VNAPAAAQPPAEDPEALRHCIRELVAFSTLPAAWARADPAQIADDLAVAVSRTLPAELVCVQLDTASTAVLRAARRGLSLRDGALAAVGSALRPWLTGGGSEPETVHDPEDGGLLRPMTADLGHQPSAGRMVAAAGRPGYPSELDRLLLSVAANQAAVALQRRQAELALWRSQRELTDFFDNASVALHLVGPDGIILRANQAELDMLGYRQDEYVGRHVAEFHVDPAESADILRRLTSGETIVEREVALRCKDGSVRQVLIDSSGSWQDGVFINTRSFTRDVTDRRRAEQNARFLGAAGAALAVLDDPQETLRRICTLAVPEFADWCWVHVAGGETSVRLLELAHEAPDRLALARGMARRHPCLVADHHPVAKVWKQQAPFWLPRLDEAHRREMAMDEDHLEELRALGWRSLLSVPVTSRGATRAVLSFATGHSGRELREEERRAAEDLASRAAVALDNAGLLGALREEARRKDEFLAILAHELRNPLAPLRNAVEILRAKGPPVPELQWARSMIDRQAQQMARLVDDLLGGASASRWPG
jgi:PAS domain S-box-containing protein